MPRATKSSSSFRRCRSPYDATPLASSHSPDTVTKTSSLSSSNFPTLSSKRKHACSTCGRAFTTSGHLARHTRIHTGERNHHCPFPGCGARCSRQDNLQQHYRIHLAPGSRRSGSARAILARAMNGGKEPLLRLVRRKTTSISNAEYSSSVSPRSSPTLVDTRPTPPLTPPPLEQARLYTLTPPDSPPPLVQATLPATLYVPSSSPATTPSPSPFSSYSSLSNGLVPVPATGSSVYSYRSTAMTYHEQPQILNYAYINTEPTTITPPPNPVFSYPSPQQEYERSVAQLSTLSLQHDVARDIAPLQGRVSYTSRTGSFAGPPSPASTHSVPSQTSSPTPNYPSLSDALPTYTGYVSQYSSFTAYPLQNNRVQPTSSISADHQVDRSAREQLSAPYIHQPQPIASDSYSYQSPFIAGNGVWRADANNH